MTKSKNKLPSQELKGMEQRAAAHELAILFRKQILRHTSEAQAEQRKSSILTKKLLLESKELFKLFKRFMRQEGFDWKE